MKEGGANLRWPVEGLACCRMLGELSTVSQCEQVAEFLHEAQVASEQTGDVVRAHVLAVACHICLTCSQCRAEVERHRRAYKEADQREHELRQQLHTILELISGHDPPETVERQERPPSPPTVEMSTPERGTPEPVERLSLWQRFQALLGRRLPPPSPERESPGVSAEALAPPPVRKKEEQSPPSLAVYCLGPFRVYQDDQPVADWPSSKGKCDLQVPGHAPRTPRRQRSLDGTFLARRAS